MMTDAKNLVDRFASLLQNLLQATGNECPKRRHLLTWPLALGIGKRIRSFAVRFTALVVRWQAGKLRPPGPPRRRTAPAPADRPPPPEMHPLPASLLPRAFAWLHRIFPLSAPAATGRLDSMLRNETAMAEFVAAVPQAGRILRPCCRMLGIRPPEWLALPKRPRRPRLRSTPSGLRATREHDPSPRPPGTSPGASLPARPEVENAAPAPSRGRFVPDQEVASPSSPPGLSTAHARPDYRPKFIWPVAGAIGFRGEL
jgi:hypothetical protein